MDELQAIVELLRSVADKLENEPELTVALMSPAFDEDALQRMLAASPEERRQLAQIMRGSTGLTAKEYDLLLFLLRPNRS